MLPATRKISKSLTPARERPSEATANIDDLWTRPVEVLALSERLKDSRIIGVTSPVPGCGVTTLTRALAHARAASKKHTLAIDFSSPILANGNLAAWNPIVGGGGQIARRDPLGFDVLKAGATKKSRALFNDPGLLQNVFESQLAHYDAIILDLPSLLPFNNEVINPCALALASQSIILVCGKSKVEREELRKALSNLSEVGVTPKAAVFNEMGAKPAREEFAHALERSRLPFSKWAARRIRNSRG